MPAPRAVEALFRGIVARRIAIVIVYALVAVPAALLVARIPKDDAIERMVVASDPDVVATGEFRRVFPERQTVLLLAEAEDPLSPEAVAGVVALEHAIGRVAGAVPISAVTIAERMRPGIGSPDRRAELRRFLGGTPFFRRQGLLGDDFLGLAVELDARGPAERNRVLAGIERCRRGEARPARPSGRPVPPGPARGRGLHERVPGARDGRGRAGATSRCSACSWWC